MYYVSFLFLFLKEYSWNKIKYLCRSSEDLVHRLFVCIAGVADQLQTNFASDLRNILKCVFLMNSSQVIEDVVEGSKNDNSTSKIQSTNDTVETRNINERQEPLSEYETNIEESTLSHDRGRNIFCFYIFLFFLKCM